MFRIIEVYIYVAFLIYIFYIVIKAASLTIHSYDFIFFIHLHLFIAPPINNSMKIEKYQLKIYTKWEEFHRKNQNIIHFVKIKIRRLFFV